VLPVGRAAAGPAPGPAELAALPIVGAVVGALAGGVGALAARALPAPLAAALALGATVALTGALHLDGFLDGCDAFAAPVPAERRLEILKDPRHGTFAVAGMFVVGSIWLAALATLVARPDGTFVADVAFAAALARLAATANAFAFPDARGEANRALAVRPPRLPLALGAAALVVAGAALAPWGWALVPLAVAAALGIGRAIAGRLGGGLVGDAYGFTIVVLEVALLVALVALGRGGN
jgi:adenosylcobinamide-GDP ribazoletransferase